MTLMNTDLHSMAETQLKHTTEARRKASRELTRMTAEFTRLVWEINV